MWKAIGTEKAKSMTWAQRSQHNTKSQFKILEQGPVPSLN